MFLNSTSKTRATPEPRPLPAHIAESARQNSDTKEIREDELHIGLLRRSRTLSLSVTTTTSRSARGYLRRQESRYMEGIGTVATDAPVDLQANEDDLQPLLRRSSAPTTQRRIDAILKTLRTIVSRVFRKALLHFRLRKVWTEHGIRQHYQSLWSS